MFLAANDMCNLHQIVIYHAGKIVRWEAVTFLYDKIAYCTRCKCNLAADNIGDHHRYILRHGKADRYVSALSFGLFNIAFVWELFGAGIRKGLFLRFSFFAKRIKLFGGIEAVIGLLFVEQFLCVFIVDVYSLRLQIRPVWSADFGAFVPLDSEPSQVVHNLLCGGRGVAFLVRIFDAENKCSARSLGQEPVKKGCSRSADVQIAGWRRCKTCYDLLRHSL